MAVKVVTMRMIVHRLPSSYILGVRPAVQWRFMPLVLVRRANTHDEDFLVHGNSAMAMETEHRALDVIRLRQGVRGLFENPVRGVYYIAEIDGEPAGHMLITNEWSDWRNGDFWWIQSVFVVPRLRGQGVFRALYAHIEKLARADEGVCSLRLSVENANTAAQATYRRCGMQRADYQMFETDFVLGRPELTA